MLGDESRLRLRELLGGQLGGAEPAAAVMTDLHAIDFDLGQVARAASPSLGGQETGAAYTMSIPEEAVPVKKSVGDWLLFRKTSTVRRRLFGEKLDQPIPPEVKQKRLPETARAAFLEMIDNSIKEKLPILPAKYSESLATAYVTKFRSVILEKLRQQRDQFATDYAQRQAPFETIAAIQASMKDLAEQSSKAVADIILMAQQETGMPLEAAGGNATALPEGELASGASFQAA
jgi:hypothetical protein